VVWGVGHEKKGYVDLSDKSGDTILCLLCQDGKGKTDGVIALHRPFSKYFWAVHEQGDKHCKPLKQHHGEEELIAEGKMKEKKSQSQLFGYFPSTGKKKKYLTMKDGSVS
jgi:hypothetical protein